MTNHKRLTFIPVTHRKSSIEEQCSAGGRTKMIKTHTVVYKNVAYGIVLVISSVMSEKAKK